MLLSFAGQTGRAKMVDLAKGFWSDAPRILPLGDSNTQGRSNLLSPDQFEGYRRELWSLATQDGFWFDYVGGLANGPASLPDRNHQGVSGTKATTVVGEASGLATTHRPDVVLLMLGTNDARFEANAASTVPGELLSIMRSIDAVQPKVTILLAPVPPLDPTAGGSMLANADQIRDAINAQLPDLAQAAQAEGIDARFAPMSNLGTGDLYDGVHLRAAGHTKIAATFYQALKEGLSRGDFEGARTSTAGVLDLTGSEAGDLLGGDAAVNRIDGRGGADRIKGGAGADVLTGGNGADVLIGGIGNDLFRYLDVTRSTPRSRDVIRAGDGAVAFQSAGAVLGDRFDLSRVDANAALSGVQDFVFGTATGQGRLWAVNSGSNTLIRGNTDSDTAAEFEIAIEDRTVLASAYTAADFLL